MYYLHELMIKNKKTVVKLNITKLKKTCNLKFQNNLYSTKENCIMYNYMSFTMNTNYIQIFKIMYL